jgi:hypothetical protein
MSCRKKAPRYHRSDLRTAERAIIRFPLGRFFQRLFLIEMGSEKRTGGCVGSRPIFRHFKQVAPWPLISCSAWALRRPLTTLK